MNHVTTLALGLLTCVGVLAADTSLLDQVVFQVDDFVSASSDPKHPQNPAIVLRVPKIERRASTWNPLKEKIPISPEDAIKKVFASEIVRNNPKDWTLLNIQLSARHPMEYSDIETATGSPLNDSTLITSYLIDICRIADGKDFCFMVLMNGKVYCPRFEKRAQ